MNRIITPHECLKQAIFLANKRLKQVVMLCSVELSIKINITNLGLRILNADVWQRCQAAVVADKPLALYLGVLSSPSILNEALSRVLVFWYLLNQSRYWISILVLLDTKPQHYQNGQVLVLSCQPRVTVTYYFVYNC